MSQPYRLTSESKSKIRRLLAKQPQPFQPLGMILQEADLVSWGRIELALQTQTQYPNLRLGEILAMCDWIKPETADFFAQDWSNVIQQQQKDPLGYYFKQAALLNEAEIETVLAEQRRTGIRFGTVAVLQGFIKSTTLDFFLMYLFPNELETSPFVNMYSKSSQLD